MIKKILLAMGIPALLLAEPSNPSHLQLQALSKSAVSLAWQDNANDETGFKIYRDSKLIMTVPENVHRYVDRGLRASTRYRYTVKATTDLVTTNKTIYSTSEAVTIFVTDMSGDSEDWVAIYPVGAKNTFANIVSYKYTNGVKAGKFDLGSVPAGDYEARVFNAHSWEPRATYAFSVAEDVVGDHKEIFISTKGSDQNNGTKALPVKTLNEAASRAHAGDTIYIRQGTYPLGIRLGIKGERGAPITISAYHDEAVLFEGDKSLNGNNDFRISHGDWIILKNFEIKHSYNGLLIEYASHNIVDNVISHDNYFSGFAITRHAAYNTIINCEAYNNFDVGGSLGDGGHADGFGTGSRIGDDQFLGKGNRFINCKSWHNSDDGFDFWQSGEAVTVINCEAHDNGFADGDGNGFKLGKNNPLKPHDEHVLINCRAWDNKQYGFDYNENEEAIRLYKNSAYNNLANYSFLGKAADIMIANKSIDSKQPNRLSQYIIDVNNAWDSKEAFTDAKSNQITQDMVVIGDSTVASYPLDYAIGLGGWGEFLPFYFPKSKISNFAKSGKSSKTFYHDGFWDKAYQKLKRGDLLLMQFGHNDSHVGKPEGTTIEEYKEYLNIYITKTKEKGALPILVSPMHRLNFNADGTLRQDLKKYETAMREVAGEEDIPFINLYALSETLFKSLGKENSRFISSPDREDTTHFSKTGAAILGSLVADEIIKILEQ